jgi:hypothetical protein
VEDGGHLSYATTVGQSSTVLEAEIGHPWNAIREIGRTFPVAESVLVFAVVITHLTGFPYIITITVVIALDAE